MALVHEKKKKEIKNDTNPACVRSQPTPELHRGEFAGGGNPQIKPFPYPPLSRKGCKKKRAPSGPPPNREGFFVSNTGAQATVSGGGDEKVQSPKTPQKQKKPKTKKKI